MRLECCQGGTSLSGITTTAVLCCRNAIRFYGARLNTISFIPIRKVRPFMRCSPESDFTEIGQYRPMWTA